MHQPIHGEASKLESLQRRHLQLSYAKQSGRGNLRQGAVSRQPVDLHRKANLGIEIYGVIQLEIGNDVTGTVLDRPVSRSSWHIAWQNSPEVPGPAVVACDGS